MAKAGKPRRYSESKGISGEGISGELQRLRYDEFGIKDAQQASPSLLGPWHRPWGTQTERAKWDPFCHTHTLRHSTCELLPHAMPFAIVPIRYGAKGCGRTGFATPTPFATVPTRYGDKG
uniref:Uncharacterized protein n=1 Tax=Oryza sativa subsp. japonica TaxID=39947 RepID=Q6YX48_ORYSJ|nr:hypothetical protein [Oryza sativa Japonica Group]